MLESNVRPLLHIARSSLAVYVRRNFGVTTIVAQKSIDPIQKLFAEKVKEYSHKSKAAGGKLFEASPEIEKELKEELNRIEKQYGGGKGVDLTKFPTLNFQDPKIDPINLEK